MLTDVMVSFPQIYTVPQVMSEVSNLTDLNGMERLVAREVLKRTIHAVVESDVSSAAAADHPLFSKLGLTDAAIALAAREHECLVLSDDLPLYLWLLQTGVSAINYTHLRERFKIL